MRLRRFLISCAALVAVVIAILWLIGLSYLFLEFLADLLFRYAPGAFLTLIAVLFFDKLFTQRFNNKVNVATPQEMQREDDVLLQAVAISQSILFFAVNLAEENGSKLIISALIVIFAGSFYILRAYAKIKDSAKYRYYSMLALALVIGDTVYGGLALVTFQSTLLSSPLFPLSSATIRIYLDYIFLAIPIFLFDFFGRIFKKRYGYKTS